MADKFYAVTDIKYGNQRDWKGNYRQIESKTISAGDEVSKAQLGVSDDEWNTLVQTGVVGTKKNDDGTVEPVSSFPDDPNVTSEEDAKVAEAVKKELDKRAAANA